MAVFLAWWMCKSSLFLRSLRSSCIENTWTCALSLMPFCWTNRRKRFYMFSVGCFNKNVSCSSNGLMSQCPKPSCRTKHISSSQKDGRTQFSTYSWTASGAPLPWHMVKYCSFQQQHVYSTTNWRKATYTVLTVKKEHAGSSRKHMQILLLNHNLHWL